MAADRSSAAAAGRIGREFFREFESNMAMTQAQVMALAKPGKHLVASPGLYAIVVTATRRYWQFRYTRDGKERAMSLGPIGPIPLSGAKELHRQALSALAAGSDPLDERHAGRRPPEPTPPPKPSFREVATDYIAAHEPAWRNPHHRWQWRQTVLEVACATLGDIPVDQITVEHVLGVLQPIWQAKPETASRLRGRIEVILDYARVRGWRDGPNPAIWRGNLAHLLPSPTKLRPVKHLAALDWRAAPEFMAKLSMQTGGMGAIALQFAILTAARSGEVRLATWSEIDLKAALWRVPAERMKAGKEHRVPLSDAAVALLERQAEVRQNDLVFPGPSGTPLSDMTLGAVLRRMGRSELTAHGFRSTFRDWAADNGKPDDAAEASLAHQPTSKVKRAYARSDLLELRRPLMAAWAAFLARPAATVVALPASGRAA